MTNISDLTRSTIPPVAIFLDDGGVLNDNRLRGPEWLRLIGDFMPGRLGGSAAAWASANQVVFPDLWRTLQARLPDFASHRDFHHAYATQWMSAMCARVGVDCPPADEAVALFNELSIHVAERAASAIDGAADAVRSLHRAGYTLYTASGTTSWELRGIMAKMRIAECFTRLYGPDIIDHVKHGPAFYQKLLAHAAVAPHQALIIESDPHCCRWARTAGAQTACIAPDPTADAPTLAALAQAFI